MAKYATRRRPDGRWEARHQDARVLGPGVRLSAYGPTRKEAVAKLDAKVEARRRRADIDHAPGWTLAQFLRWWTGEELPARVEDDTLAITSLRAYTNLAAELSGRLGHVRLADLSPAHVRRLLDDARADGRSAHRRRRLHQILGVALSTAVRYEMIAANPVGKVPAPKAQPRGRPDVTFDQARRFLHTAEGDGWFALWRLMLSVPLRPGEPRAVGWDDTDLDLDAGSYRVARNLVQARIDGQMRYARLDTKGHHARTVPLPAVTVAALRKHRLRATERRLELGEPPAAVWERSRGRWVRRDVRPVFPGVRGGWLSTAVLRTRLAGVCERAGVPVWSPHDLRRVAVTLLTEDTHPRVLQQLCGHTDLSLTDIYTGTLNKQMREAVDRLAERLA